MKVAFVSECTAFYSILSNDLSSRFPSLVFEHFEDPNQFLNSEGYGYQHFILKLSSDAFPKYALDQIRKRFPVMATIGLVLGRNFSSQKGLENEFDFLFRDSELEEKLRAYFFNIFPDSEDPTSSEVLMEIKKKYIALDPLKSRCLMLIYQKKKASEIAIHLNKSIRTVEKYIVFLRNHFNVKRKQDLITICEQIIS